ncbi:MAG: hypothetical protein IKV96_01215, partial [Firmicutes bacterium]|nr:hypothetical protein [Bacillota bacterium]
NSARINIIVKDPSVWSRLAELDPADIGFDLPIETISENETNQFILDEDSEWSANELQTSAFCRYMSAVAPEECIIIADCTDLEGEKPLHYCFWYLASPYVAAYKAGSYFDEFLGYDEEDGREDMREKTDIHDIAGWFRFLGHGGNPKYKEGLAEYGIQL